MLVFPRHLPNRTSAPVRVLIALATLSLVTTGAWARDNITAAPQALLSGDAITGWTVGAEVKMGSREFVAGSDLIETDLRLISAYAGFHLLPFLQPWLEAGTSKADRETFDGENGVLVGGGLSGDLLEWILEGNPSLERKRVLTVGGKLAIRRFESNYADADFNWTEIEVNPGLTYTHNRLGHGEWLPWSPIETAFRGSLVFSQIEGDFGTGTVEGNRNFAFRLGYDMLWQRGLTSTLEGTFFGDKDRMLGIGIGYHF